MSKYLSKIAITLLSLLFLSGIGCTTTNPNYANGMRWYSEQISKERAQEQRYTQPVEISRPGAFNQKPNYEYKPVPAYWKTNQTPQNASDCMIDAYGRPVDPNCQ